MEVGEIIEGKVTGITKFGAFVALPEGKSGLVHISEVANTFVSDINEFLHNGETVKVKVLAIAPDGKINLSIKKAMDPPEGGFAPRRDHSARPGDNRGPRREGGAPRRDFASGKDADSSAPRSYQRPSSRPQGSSRPQQMNGGSEVYGSTGDAGFEDKLAAFLKDSNSKMSESRLYEQPKRTNRRRK